MNDASAADQARTAALRRIGRNLVNVQRIELMLKFLLNVNFTGPLQDVEVHFAKHLEKRSRKTIGALITDLAGTVLLPDDTVASAQSNNEVWISSSLKVPLDAEALDAWSREWEVLRIERNKLVHLMLGKVNFNSPEQCRMLDLELDAQNVVFLKGIAFLGPVVTAAKEAIAEMASSAKL